MNTNTRTLDAATLTHLQSWIGKTETLTDQITASPVRALSATLDRDDRAPVAGTPLPPLWHWLFFLPQPRQSELGPDGHAKRGGFLPPVPLPRRMWAGGRLRWHPDNPLVVGDVVKRVSRIESVTHKAGRTGDLLFVLVKHEVHNAKGLALSEEHDIVYRADAAPTLVASRTVLPPEGTNFPGGGPSKNCMAPTLGTGHLSALNAGPAPVAAEQGAAWTAQVVPDDVLLFRYSALTFNGHRIHYDRRYVTEVEGYPGLIVHGPLIATLLVDLLRKNLPDASLSHFEFRAVRPVFDVAPFKLHGAPAPDGKTVRLWTEDHEGWLTMQATATLA
nr:MaoC family dehydratase N-terminal domain-containing protein [Rhodoferax sp.]